MKIKDFIDQHNIKFEEDECELCQLHEEAYKKLTMVCPECGNGIYMDDFKKCPVGLENVVETNSEIFICPVGTCPSCDCDIALIPTKIIYNANHDIYYTGGKTYVIGDIPFNGRLRGSIKQYTERILAGENLKPWNLEVWLQYDIEHIIAEYLYNNGFKK